MNRSGHEEPYAERSMLKVARALTRALLAGDGSAVALQARGLRTLGGKWPWLGKLAGMVRNDFGDALRPDDHDEIVQAILRFEPFRRAFEPGERWPEIRGHFPYHEAMAAPLAALAQVSLPALNTPGDLARWLGISVDELNWFADVGAWGGESASEPLRHYRYLWRQKATGGLRLIEAPKPRLREIQRKILREILDLLPAHTAAHGCVRGRSVISNAAPHAGKAMVIRLDLADFFASVGGGRVIALFRALGYPLQTARCLAGLTTHRTPRAVLESLPVGEYALPDARRRTKAWASRFTARHLPQGAPTSAALANLCAYRLDLRLAGAAQACRLTYTRYVDDLFFSGAMASRGHTRRFSLMAYSILLDEGFAANERKTRAMSRSCAQFVTGLVVNSHPNAPRREYDCLKAILTNCVRHGAKSQNRDAHADFRAHLLGRLSWVGQMNPARGKKLRALFEDIDWN